MLCGWNCAAMYQITMSLRGAIATRQSPGKHCDAVKGHLNIEYFQIFHGFQCLIVDRLYQEIATSGRLLGYGAIATGNRLIQRFAALCNTLLAMTVVIYSLLRLINKTPNRNLHFRQKRAPPRMGRSLIIILRSAPQQPPGSGDPQPQAAYPHRCRKPFPRRSPRSHPA